MTEVKWPNGYATFYAQVRSLAPVILNDRMLAIDPSSAGKSPIGYAVYQAGKLTDNGIICLPNKLPIHKRLPIILDELSSTFGIPDILAIEEIHGSISTPQLQWAIGVTIAATRPPEHLIVPLNVWKSVAKVDPTYRKEDSADARMIGNAAVLLANKFSQTEE